MNRLDNVEAQRLIELSSQARHSEARAAHFQRILTLRLAGRVYVKRLDPPHSVNVSSSGSNDETSTGSTPSNRKAGLSTHLQPTRKALPKPEKPVKRRKSLENQIATRLEKKAAAKAAEAAKEAAAKASKEAAKKARRIVAKPASNKKSTVKRVIPSQARGSLHRSGSSSNVLDVQIDPVLLHLNTYQPAPALRRTQSSTNVLSAASDDDLEGDLETADDAESSEGEEVDQNVHDQQLDDSDSSSDEDSDGDSEDAEGESDPEEERVDLEVEEASSDDDDDIPIFRATEDDCKLLQEEEMMNEDMEIDVDELSQLLIDTIEDCDTPRRGITFMDIDRYADSESVDEGWEHLL